MSGDSSGDIVVATSQRSCLGVAYQLELAAKDDGSYQLEAVLPLPFGKRYAWYVADDCVLNDNPRDIDYDIADEPVEAIECLARAYISSAQDTITRFFGGDAWRSYLESGQVTMFEVVSVDNGGEYAPPTAETHLFASREQALALAVEVGLAAITDTATDEDEADEPSARAGIIEDDPLDKQYQLVADYCARHTDVTISVHEVRIERENDDA